MKSSISPVPTSLHLDYISTIYSTVQPLPCTDNFRLPTRSGRCPLVVMGSTGSVRQDFLHVSWSPSSPLPAISSLIVSVVMVILVCLMSSRGDGGGSGLTGGCCGSSCSCSSWMTPGELDVCERRTSSGVLGVRGVLGVLGGSPSVKVSAESGSVICIVAAGAVGDGVCMFDEGDGFGTSFADGFYVQFVYCREKINQNLN